MIDTFLAGFFLFAALGIVGGVGVLLVRARGKSTSCRRVPDGGLVATAAAALVSLGLIGAAVGLFVEKSEAPPILVVKVTGFQFGWRFEYFTGEPLHSLGVSTTGRLVLPQGIDVEVLATSSDVIHRLEIPELRVRRDLVPELVSHLKVHATRGGEFLVLSDGLCGAPSGVMAAPLTVVDLGVFHAWIAEQAVVQAFDHKKSS